MLVTAEADIALAEAIKGRGYAPRTIYDVGGSDGVWSISMAQVFPSARYEIFEPLWGISQNYNSEVHSLRASGLDHRVNAFAVGEHDGITEMTVFPDPRGSTSLPFGSASGVEKVEVPVRSIDSLVASSSHPVPDFIKMDIQGGEFAALKGATATLPQVQFLMLETWLQRRYGPSTPLLHELMEFLASHGFFPYEFTDVYRGKLGESIAIDVTFINRAKAHKDVIL